jgi:hypothetical protein
MGCCPGTSCRKNSLKIWGNGVKLAPNGTKLGHPESEITLVNNLKNSF